MQIKIINTSDGSKTLFVPEMNEQYHSVNGAITESNYVFLEKGYRFHTEKKPKIFEVGFGTGLNCLLTAIEAEKEKRPTTFYTIEKYPLDAAIIQQLNYGKLISVKAQTIFEKLHDCAWETTNKITEYFSLKKIRADLTSDSLDNIEACDIIYFDAFGPNKQPSMWQPKIYKKMYELNSTNGVFVTYSAKGEVRRQLAAEGYQMERLPGPPGKNQMLRGIKF